MPHSHWEYTEYRQQESEQIELKQIYLSIEMYPNTSVHNAHHLHTHMDSQLTQSLWPIRTQGEEEDEEKDNRQKITKRQINVDRPMQDKNQVYKRTIYAGQRRRLKNCQWQNKQKK